jgi:hypothetical protein
MTPRKSLSMPAVCCVPVTRGCSLNSVFVKDVAPERNLDSRDFSRLLFSVHKCIIGIQVMERDFFPAFLEDPVLEPRTRDR